jgi:simple sugar transport system permease protein
MSIERLTSMLLSLLGSAAPLCLAALGGLATEAAGSLSIALEGYMLVGAFAAAVAGHAGLGLAAALAAGAIAGTAIAFLVAAAALTLKADVFVAGLAANMLASGLVSMISQAAFGTKGVVAAESMRADPLVLVLSLAGLALLVYLSLSRSVFGLRLRAAGEGGEVAKAAGIDQGKYRFAAHLIAGAAAGVAGASLAAGIGAYVPGMSTGRGWIALVAVFLGSRRSGGVLLSSIAFGSLFALSTLAQSAWGGGNREAFSSSASELMQALPYLATAIALIAWKLREKAKGREAS